MDKKFDAVVIGGGPGGYVAAIRASLLGLKVAIIEEGEMGGTCLNRGCIPTKALLHSAEVYNTVKHSSQFGINVEDISYDYGRICKNKDSVVKRLRTGVEYLVKGNGVQIIPGKGCIKDKNTIEITGKENCTANTDKIIIATGSLPLIPPIPGIDGSKVMNSDEVLEMTECPGKIIIIGGGVIGVEFATILNFLGKDVTIVEMMETLIPSVDTEISTALRKSLEAKGVKVFLGSKVTSILSEKDATCNFMREGKMQEVRGDRIVVAIGRKPNVQNLGLENIGVTLEKGFIMVNERMETSVKGVYAIGDVTGKSLLAHVASAQGIVSADNAAGKNHMMDYTIIPGCIYTHPEIASVGMTEEEAINRKIDYKVGKFQVNANGKAMIMGEKEGLVKIITDQRTGEILGAHIMGPRATDMIAEICVAMKLESTVDELSRTIHPHPTVSEMIMEAAHDVEGLCVHKRNRKP